MAGNSPNAIKISKSVMNEGNDLTVAQGLALELDQFAAVFSSEALTFTKTRSPKGLTVETLKDTAAIDEPSPDYKNCD